MHKRSSPPSVRALKAPLVTTTSDPSVPTTSLPATPTIVGACPKHRSVACPSAAEPDICGTTGAQRVTRSNVKNALRPAMDASKSTLHRRDVNHHPPSRPGLSSPFRRGLCAASLATQLQLDGVDAGGLIGERELDELGVVVDVCVVAGPD